MSGSEPYCGSMEFYNYLMPGIYDYPVTHSAAATITAYNLPPIMHTRLNPWNEPSICPATYVAGPQGVINYLSDMQSHLALPTNHSLRTGVIYAAINPNPETLYPHQSPCDFGHMEGERDEYGYVGFRIPPVCLNFAHCLPVSEEEDGMETPRRPAKRYSQIKMSGDSGSGTGSGGRRKRRKVNRRRVYEAEQGYLVEEPSSDQSEEDHEEPPALPST
ncbi:hypothetical protein KR009_012201 [Drosophila setifemur]|nr:hypothetical protein KR009_012201 [Drosophila setifemur]